MSFAAGRDFHMEDRSLELQLLPLEGLPVREPVSIASRLWSMLDEAHGDMNGLCRTNPNGLITDIQIELVNELLEQVISLLHENGHGDSLRLLDGERPTTYADVLLILGLFKGALRAFRVDVLGENAYKF